MAFSFNQGDRPLEGYTIQRGVGRGGFGEVYHALSDGGKEVALKYLRENPQIELRGVQHCLNLKSPHIVTLYDVKQNAGGDWFVIMEYVAGPSLRDLLLDAPKGLGAQKAAYFLREMGKGLTYLHDRGIVHRDMKPGNLFYEDGYVKIGDYGLSKIMSPSQHSGQTMSVGTVHYMAPEVGSGNYSRTIDIYAIGVILYEMLLGRVPYQGATMGEVLMKHLTAQPEVDELPAPFPQVIRKALAKDPNDRYQTVPEMVNEVFAGADMQASVNSFEPASLSAVAARIVKPSIESPSPRPGEPGRPGPGSGSSNVGHFAAETIAAPQGFGPRGPSDAVAVAMRTAQAAAESRGVSINRRSIEKLALALLITTGVSLAAAWFASDGRGLSPAMVPVSFALIAAMVGGALLGTYISFVRIQQVGYWPHRFINAGCVTGLLGAMIVLATPFWLAAGSMTARTSPPSVTAQYVPAPMGVEVEQQEAYASNDVTALMQKYEKGNSKTTGQVPAVSAQRRGTRGAGNTRVHVSPSPARRSSTPEPWNWAPPLLLLILLGDWTGRVFRGRQGHVDFTWAASAALFAFVAGRAIGPDDHAGAIAIIAAAASVALQLVASLWPMKNGERIPQTSRGRPASVFMDDTGGAAVAGFPTAHAARSTTNETVDSDHVGVERSPVRRVPPILAPLRSAASNDVPAFRDVEPLSPLRAPERTHWARTLWLMLGTLFVFASIILFVCYGNDIFTHAEEAAAACASAAACMGFGLFGLTRALGRQKRGLWRGVFRPLVFTTGVAGIAASGIMMGHLEWIYHGDPGGWSPRDTANMREAWIISLVCLIASIIISLFVWLVPAQPYAIASVATPKDDSQRLRRRIRWLVAGSIGVASVMAIAGVIIDEELRGSTEEIVMVVTMIPLGLAFIGCIVAAAMSQHQLSQLGLPKPEKLKLPIQHHFVTPRINDLDDLITRHFMLLGYKPANRARLLWSFERGSWAQMWQSDVRKHRTTVNVAAYDTTDGYRITCLTDIDNMWNPPGKKDLVVLLEELRGLEELLCSALAAEPAVQR